MSRIYWDSMLFVYLWEEHPHFTSRMGEILEMMNRREDRLCTSVFTVGEVLTGLLKRGESRLAERIRAGFQDPAIELIDFRVSTAEYFALIRGSINVSSADGIHLATAAEVATDLFLTNDAFLIGKQLPGIGRIAGLDSDLY